MESTPADRISEEELHRAFDLCPDREQRLEQLDQMKAAADNFYLIAMDMQHILESNQQSVDEDVADLVTFLAYFCRGCRWACSTCSRNGWEPAEQLENACEQLEDLFRKLSETDGSAPPPSRVTHRQPLEILFHALLTTHVPCDLTRATSEILNFESMTIYKQKAYGEGEGLPRVVFICATHGVVRCSKDIYGSRLWALTNHMEKFRKLRFEGEQQMLQHRKLYRGILARFGQVKNSRSADVKRKISDSPKELSEEECNDIVADMVDGSRVAGVALAASVGYNHLGEHGQAYRASGENMMSEISRCIKCRFKFHYSRSMHPEDPRTTALRPYRVFGCAEDLAHWRCAELGTLGKGTVEIELPFPDLAHD